MSSLPPLSILSSTFFFLLPVLKLILVCGAYSTSRRTTRRSEWCYASVSLLAVLGTLGGTFELLSIKKLLYMRAAAKICRVLLQLTAGLCTIILIVLSTPTTTVPVMNMTIFVIVLIALPFCGMLLSLLHVSPLLGPLFYLLFATAALPLEAYVFLSTPSPISTRTTDTATSPTPPDVHSPPSRSYMTLSVPPSPSSNIQKKAMSLDLPSQYKHTIVFPVHQRASLDHLERARTSAEHSFALTPGSRVFGVHPYAQSQPTQSARPKTRHPFFAVHQSPEDFTALHPRILWTLILLSELAVLIASSLQICGYVLSDPLVLPQFTLAGSLGDVLNPPTYPPGLISDVGQVNRSWQLYPPGFVRDSKTGFLNAINVAADNVELSTGPLVFKALSDVYLVLSVVFVMCAALASIYVDVPCGSSFGPIVYAHPITVSTSTQTQTTETLYLKKVPSEASFRSGPDGGAGIGSKSKEALLSCKLKSNPSSQSDSIALALPSCHSTRYSPHSRCQSEDFYRCDGYDVRTPVDLEGPKDVFTPLPQRRKGRKCVESGTASPGSSPSRRRNLKLRTDHNRRSTEAAIATMDDTRNTSGTSPRIRLSRISQPRHLPKPLLTQYDDSNGASFSRSLSLPLSDTHTDTVMSKNSSVVGVSLSRSSSFVLPMPKRRPEQPRRGSSTRSMIDIGNTHSAGCATDDVLTGLDKFDGGAWRKPLDNTSMERIGLGLRDPSLNPPPSPYSCDQFALVSCPAYSDDETSNRDSPCTSKHSTANSPTTTSVSDAIPEITPTRPPQRPARSLTFQFLPNFPTLRLSQIKLNDVKKSPSRKGGDAIRMSALSVSSSTPIWATNDASGSVNNGARGKDEACVDLEEVPLGDEEGSEQEIFRTPSTKKFQCSLISSSQTSKFKPKSSPSSPSSPLNTFVPSKSPTSSSSPSFYSDPSPNHQNQAMNLAPKSSPSKFPPKISPSKPFARSQSQRQSQPRPKLRPPILRKLSVKYDHGYTPFGGYDPDPFAAPEPGAMMRDSAVDLVEEQGRTRMSAWGTLTLPVPPTSTGSGSVKRTGTGLRRSPTSPALASDARAGTVRPHLKSGPSIFQAESGASWGERNSELGQRLGGHRREDAGLEGEYLVESLPVEEALLAQRLLKRLNRRAERGAADRKPVQGRGRERAERGKESAVGRSFLLGMNGNGVVPARPF